MQLTKYIILFTVLILTTLVTNSTGNADTVCTENSLGDQTCVTTNTTTTVVPGVTTNNLISQNFQDGSWTHSVNQQFHGSGTLATTNTSESSTTISLSDTLTKPQINAGFSSTFGLNIWFWSGYSASVTMKQTLTSDTGTVITQQRVVSGTSGGNGTYTDTIIVAANSQSNYDINAKISTSVPGTSTTSHLGPDINYPTLVVTTNDTSTTSTTTSETFTYCYDRVPNACTYDNTALKEIETLKTSDGKTYDEYVEDAIKLDEFNIETTVLVEDLDGNITEVKIEDYAVETFDKFISTNGLTETFETALVEENITKEEFYDTMATEIKEEFETDLGGSNDLTTDTKSEDLNTDTETTKLEEANADTTTTKETTEISNSTNTESETTETNSTESNVVENKETEGSETKTDSKETVDAKETGDVKTNSGKTVDTSSIEKKVERVIAKVISKLKDVDKKLQAVQYITTKGITAGQADVSSYINKRIYGNQNLYNNVPFYENLNILEQQQIYKDVSLNTYVSNDPIAVKQRLTVEIESEISRIQAELYALKQKKG